MNKYDIGIFGLWYGHNYGSILTYYALSQIVAGKGKSFAMIENPLNTELDVSVLRRSHPIRFANEHYEITPQYGLDEMTELNKLFDTFVVGSDQMWNYSLSMNYRLSYFLDFVQSGKKRYSYAVSFGQEKYSAPPEETEKIKAELKRFDGISVRDDFSKQILRDVFGVDSDIVADPVFLCPKEQFNKLIDEVKEPDFDAGSDYIFAYILDPNLVVGDNLSRIANEMGRRIYVCFNESGDKAAFKNALGLRSDKVVCLEDPTAQEWLCLVKNSKAVLTDSFHGACFSMIFGKPFVVKKNKQRGGRRFDHLLKVFGQQDRMIDNPFFFFEKAMAPGFFEKPEYPLKNKLTDVSVKWINRI